jgi:hypothetical protein
MDNIGFFHGVKCSATEIVATILLVQVSHGLCVSHPDYIYRSFTGMTDVIITDSWPEAVRILAIMFQLHVLCCKTWPNCV